MPTTTTAEANNEFGGPLLCFACGHLEWGAQ